MIRQEDVRAAVNKGLNDDNILDEMQDYIRDEEGMKFVGQGIVNSDHNMIMNNVSRDERKEMLRLRKEFNARSRSERSQDMIEVIEIYSNGKSRVRFLESLEGLSINNEIEGVTIYYDPKIRKKNKILLKRGINVSVDYFIIPDCDINIEEIIFDLTSPQ